MDLGLETVHTRGRQEQPLQILAVRSLTVGEVRAHNAGRGSGEVTPPTPLQRLNTRHKRLAKLLASGTSTSEAAALVGMTPARVSILKSDPSFSELLKLYEAQFDQIFQDAAQLLQGVTEDSLIELSERIENDPSQFTNAELMALAKLGADRTGHGPVKTNENNFNVNFGDRLEEARRRIREQATKTIEGEVLDAAE